jgi:predicted transcriptional regulator
MKSEDGMELESDMSEMNYAMTVAEIAKELGISEAAVKITLRRALAKIRACPELCEWFRAAMTQRRTPQLGH